MIQEKEIEMKAKPLLIDGIPAPEVARIGIARGWIKFPPMKFDLPKDVVQFIKEKSEYQDKTKDANFGEY